MAAWLVLAFGLAAAVWAWTAGPAVAEDDERT